MAFAGVGACLFSPFLGVGLPCSSDFGPFSGLKPRLGPLFGFVVPGFELVLVPLWLLQGLGRAFWSFSALSLG